MKNSPRVLLVTHRLKEYWASDYGRARVVRIVAPETLKLPPAFRQQTRAMQFALAIYARFIAGSFDLVICVDRHLALAFGMVKQLTALKTPVMAYQFILPDNDDSSRKLLASAWDRMASGGLDTTIVNSSHEVRIYADRLSPKTRLEFVPIAAGPEVFETFRPAASSLTIFSGGSALRDYETLLRAASGNTYRVEIVARQPSDVGTLAGASNVRVRYNLPYLEFLQEMATATIVVIPLRHTERAAGQGTIIYAQAMSKAVIASDVPGVRDYIEHGVTGWLVNPGDADGLRRAIRLLADDEELRRRLESASRHYAVANYSYQAYDRRIGLIIEATIP